MFRRMIEKLDRMFHSDNNLRVRGGRRRASRRFSPSLTVAGLEMRLSLSGMGGCHGRPGLDDHGHERG